MLGRSTLEAIHLHRRRIEKNKETYEDLHMVFIDLEKTSDRVPKEVMRWVLMKKRVPLKYIKLIKDMYDEAVISV